MLVSAFGDVLLSLLFARVCFVPSVLLSKLVSLSVSCVRSLVCVLVCSFARLLIRLFLCMHLYIDVRFVFALCCRVRLLFVFVVALFGSVFPLMGPGHFSQE